MLSKKGLEIPVNMLVILAISVIVLLSVVVFFIGGFTPGSQTLQQQQAFNNCATSWVRIGCPDADSNIIDHSCSDGRTLAVVANEAGYSTYQEAARAAGCNSAQSSGSSSTGSGSPGGTSPGSGF